MIFLVSNKFTTFVHYNIQNNVQNLKTMVVISPAELRNNMKKYLDMASEQNIVIQRGRTETFVLTAREQLPDSDLERAITGEKLMAGIMEDIDAIYTRKRKGT
jgi:stalled ribosome rescue protein Dom34